MKGNSFVFEQFHKIFDLGGSTCKLGPYICYVYFYVIDHICVLCKYQRAAKLASIFLTLNPHGYLIFNAYKYALFGS